MIKGQPGLQRETLSNKKEGKEGYRSSAQAGEVLQRGLHTKHGTRVSEGGKFPGKALSLGA